MTSRILQNSACLVLLAVALAATTTATNAQSTLAGVVLDVHADRQAYVLGDPVELSMRMVNTSSRAVTMPADASVWSGHLEVWIARGNGPFQKYIGPQWGLRDVNGASRMLERGRPWAETAIILFNHGVSTDGLNAEAAAAALDNRLPKSGFAFAAAGGYRMKVRMYSMDFDEYIESAAMGISMSEPEGVDREVWRALQDPEFAYFMHAQGPNGHPASATTQAMVSRLEGLVAAYPSSRYADRMNKGLAAFTALMQQMNR